MIEPYITLVATWLDDASIGVEAMLDSLDTSGYVPDGITLLDGVDVVSEYTDPDVARDLAPIPTPGRALVIVQSYESPGDFPARAIMPYPVQGTVDVLIRVVVPRTDDPTRSAHWIGLMQRAVSRSVALPHLNNDATLQELRGVRVLPVQTIRLLETYAAVGDTQAVGAQLITFAGRDWWAAGVTP
jgi:hypothetical protein